MNWKFAIAAAFAGALFATAQPIFAEDVAIKAVGPLGDFVFDCVEESLVVGGPCGARDALDFEGQECVGGEILDLKCVLAEAGNVGGIGEKSVVIADVEGTEAEEAVAFGNQRVAELPGLTLRRAVGCGRVELRVCIDRSNNHRIRLALACRSGRFRGRQAQCRRSL